MSYILKEIPKGIENMNSTDAANLVQIAQTLIKSLDNAPYPGTFGSVSSIHSNLAISEIRLLFKALDRVFYRLGNKNASYLDHEFNVYRWDPLNRLSSSYYSSETFGTVVLTSKNFTTTLELDIPGNYQELKLAGMSMQENSRHNIRVFKNENTLLVLSNRFTWSVYFKTKALELSLFKDKSSLYNSDIFEIYKALACGNVDDFNKYINKVLNYKTWFKFTKEKLRSCFITSKEAKLRKKERQIDQTTNDVIYYENYYKDQLVMLQNLKEEYELLLKSDENVDVDEVLDYLERHRFIKTISKVDPSVIELTIEAPILYFDKDYIEDYRFPNEDIKEVMHKIFIEEKYKMWTHSKVRLDTATFRTNAITMEENDGKYIAHPHVSRYGCQGNHTSEIRKWIQNYDYIGCIEQIMTMIYNLNWTDGIVINRMLQTIYKYANKAIFENVETGQFVSFNDILNEPKEETE